MVSVNCRKGFRAGAGELLDAGEDVGGEDGRLFAKGEQRVTEQRAGGRDRFTEHGAELQLIVASNHDMLAKLQQQEAEFVLNLDAMKIHRDD